MRTCFFFVLLLQEYLQAIKFYINIRVKEKNVFISIGSLLYEKKIKIITKIAQKLHLSLFVF